MCEVHNLTPNPDCPECRGEIPGGLNERDLIPEIYKKLEELERKVNIIADHVISEDHREDEDVEDL